MNFKEKVEKAKKNVAKVVGEPVFSIKEVSKILDNFGLDDRARSNAKKALASCEFNIGWFEPDLACTSKSLILYSGNGLFNYLQSQYGQELSKREISNLDELVQRGYTSANFGFGGSRGERVTIIPNPEYDEDSNSLDNIARAAEESR